MVETRFGARRRGFSDRYVRENPSPIHRWHDDERRVPEVVGRCAQMGEGVTVGRWSRMDADGRRSLRRHRMIDVREMYASHAIPQSPHLSVAIPIGDSAHRGCRARVLERARSCALVCTYR